VTIAAPCAHMKEAVDRPSTRLATRLAFFVAGFATGCWAPQVPFTKQRLGADDDMLGILLLCLGIGSVCAMVFAGGMSRRFGSRFVILAGGIGLALFLPLFSLADSAWSLGIFLFAFGASLGSLDVAMNIHAIEVERRASRPLMSGFHGLYSLGGFAGAMFFTSLLSLQLGAFKSSLLGAGVIMCLIAAARGRLLQTAPTVSQSLFDLPRGIVWLIAGLAGISFLVEGAILDWGALFLTNRGLVEQSQGGLGYTLFSIAMMAGRFVGDKITRQIGDVAMMAWGGMVAVFGFATLLYSSAPFIGLLSFLLIGLGASNIVPILFRQAGTQTVMPTSAAISAITTLGYAGVLLGPAVIGFVAKNIGLTGAFGLLAAMFCVVPLCARRVALRPN
jgi:predicted MFS family arabinose efflux permease